MHARRRSRFLLTVREIGVLPVDPDAREWGLNNAASFPVFYRMYFDQADRGAPPIGAPITVVNPQSGVTSHDAALDAFHEPHEGGVIEQTKNTNYGQAAVQLSSGTSGCCCSGHARGPPERGAATRPAGPELSDGLDRHQDNYQWRPGAPGNWATLAPSRPLDASGVPLAANANTPYQNDYNPPAKTTTATTKSVGGIVQLGHGFSSRQLRADLHPRAFPS